MYRHITDYVGDKGSFRDKKANVPGKPICSEKKSVTLRECYLLFAALFPSRCLRCLPSFSFCWQRILHIHALKKKQKKTERWHAHACLAPERGIRTCSSDHGIHSMTALVSLKQKGATMGKDGEYLLPRNTSWQCRMLLPFVPSAHQVTIQGLFSFFHLQSSAFGIFTMTQAAIQVRYVSPRGGCARVLARRQRYFIRCENRRSMFSSDHQIGKEGSSDTTRGKLSLHRRDTCAAWLSDGITNERQKKQKKSSL